MLRPDAANQGSGPSQAIQQSSEDFLNLVLGALAEGNHLAARRTALDGASLFPDNPVLRKVARILSPPQVLRADLPPRQDAEANGLWLQANASEYRGSWVALKKGELVSSAATVCELKERLDEDDLFLTRVV